jgi:hypothetical protein
MEKRDHVFLFRVGQIREGHAHAAEPEGGYFKTGGT